MPKLAKAAQAATLEAVGVSEKLEALRRELTAAIQRSEDHLREDVAVLRAELGADMRALRAEVANDRQAMFDLAEGFRTDGANDRKDAANDRRDAANDRQAMLEIAERIRKDGEADRQAMMALLESNRQAPPEPVGSVVA